MCSASKNFSNKNMKNYKFSCWQNRDVRQCYIKSDLILKYKHQQLETKQFKQHKHFTEIVAPTFKQTQQVRK